MNEAKVADAARAYIKILDGQNDLRPPGYSQQDYLLDCKLRYQLLDTMRDALCDPLTHEK